MKSTKLKTTSEEPIPISAESLNANSNSISTENPNSISAQSSIPTLSKSTKLMNLTDEFNIMTFNEMNEIKSNSKVHIRVKQRTTRSSITSVENLPSSYDLSIVLKKMKKKLHCIGSIQSGNDGKFIQLSGDQRMGVKKLLIDNSLVAEENIVIHGF